MPKRLIIDEQHPKDSVHTAIRLPVSVRITLEKVADSQYRTLSSMGALLIEEGLKAMPAPDAPQKAVRSFRPPRIRPGLQKTAPALTAK